MRLAVLALFASVIATPVLAQATDPMQDLILEAREALDALRYADAAEIATTLLDTGADGYVEAEVAALQLLAASLYPEEEGARHEERARGYLRRLVRTVPEATVPRQMAWPGLDSLLEETRRESLVLHARPNAVNHLRGLDASFEIPVWVTRPAQVSISAIPSEGPWIPLGSENAIRESTLVVRPHAGTEQALPPGEYTLRLEAIDDASGDAVVRQYRMEVDASPLRLLEAPSVLPSTAFRPEREPRRFTKSIVVAASVGIATSIVASALRAEPPAGTASFDGRALAIGGTLSVATLLGGWRDPGRDIPENVLYNRNLESNHRRDVFETARENDRRRAEYLVTITVRPENER